LRKEERKTRIYAAEFWHAKGKDLKEYVMRLSLKAFLIRDLQDEVTYYAILNRLLPGRFEFYLSKSKTTTVVEAVRRAQDFTHIAEILARDDLIQ